MKIAQIAPIAVRVPPKTYGGSERVVHALTEELVKRGHDVTLFASGDSLTSAKLVSFYDRNLRDEPEMTDIYGANLRTLVHAGAAYAHEGEFDIIHDHITTSSLPIANMATTPVLATLHTRFTPEKKKLFELFKRPSIAAISHSHARSAPEGTNLAGVAYNGLDLNDYPFGEKPEDFLLYVGSISLDKGTHFAVEAARKLGMRLIIGAKLDKLNEPYFKEKVEPYLSDAIQWVGEVDVEKRNDLMRRARAFLHPITWQEPFGLTLIEAMACGCPVIAFDQGSSKEIIREGETGFVVSDVEGMAEAVGKLSSIDRNACRADALTRFSAERMADSYEVLYEKVLANRH